MPTDLVSEDNNWKPFIQIELYKAEDVDKRICKSCKWRNGQYHDCMNVKIREEGGAKRQGDEMVYNFDEGGRFWVGENFGCVHWEE